MEFLGVKKEFINEKIKNNFFKVNNSPLWPAVFSPPSSASTLPLNDKNNFELNPNKNLNESSKEQSKMVTSCLFFMAAKICGQNLMGKNLLRTDFLSAIFLRTNFCGQIFADRFFCPHFFADKNFLTLKNILVISLNDFTQ